MQFLVFAVLLHSLHAQAPKGGNPFLTPKEPAAQVLTFNRALPQFTAKDTNGKTWANRNLSGKVTVIYRWQAQCLSCQETLPQIQQFFEDVKTGPDIQLLTFSDDGAPAVAVAFMKDSGYTFPVIVSSQLADKVFPFDTGAKGLWVVNREGVASQGMSDWTPGRVLIEAQRLAQRK